MFTLCRYKEKVFSCQHFVLCTVSSCRLLLADNRPPSVPNRANCGSKIELARCTDTKYRPELGHPLSKRRANCGSKIELARCTETKYRPELGHPLSKRSLGNAPFLRALFFLVWFPDPSVMRMCGRGKKSLGNNYTPARALEFDLHVPLSAVVNRLADCVTLSDKVTQYS